MSPVAVSLCLLFHHLIHVKTECVLHHQGVTGYVQKADILIGGVFPLHLNPGTEPETFRTPPSLHSCQQFSFRSFRWVLAFLFAVEEVNRTPEVLTNLTLGAAVMDSCTDAAVALRGAAWLLSGGSEGPLSYRCWGPPPLLSAVLGDAGEDSALSLAGVFGLHNYPQISYFTPPAKLSNHFLFPSTLSVAPTVSSQAKGFARLLQDFGWIWVGLLTQGTSASTLDQTFIEELRASGACLAFWENVPSSAKEMYRVAAIIRGSTAKVVVVFSLEAYLNPVLLELAHNGDRKDRIWITADAWSTSPRLVGSGLSHFLKGSLGLVLRNGAAPGFRKFVWELHPNQFNNHPLFLEFWEEAFSCRWPPGENRSSLLPPYNVNLEPSTTSVNISSAPIAALNPSSLNNMSTFASLSPSSLKPLCTGLEDAASLQIFSDINDLRVTYNVYKAVKMIAKALQDMATCQNMIRSLDTGHCADIQHFQPWQAGPSLKRHGGSRATSHCLKHRLSQGMRDSQYRAGSAGGGASRQPFRLQDIEKVGRSQLLYYLKRVRLKGNIEDDLYFDSLGNAPAIYDIISWQEELTGEASWVQVGSYESGAAMGQDLFINKSAIRWGEHFDQKIALLDFGRPHVKINLIVALTACLAHAVDCFYCPEDQWPNTSRKQCVLREVELLTLSEPLGISLGTTSIIGSILPALVLLLFIKNRDTPLVRANNCALSFILLVSLTFSFLCPLLLLASPGKQTCFVRQAAFGVTFTLCISCLLTKTVIVVLAFRANRPGGCLRVPKGLRWPILFAMYCTTVQIVICLSWSLVDPPFPENDTRSVLGKIVIQCNDSLGFWFMLGYLGLLSTVCFVVAFLARKLPGAFNEATHITFSMLVFLSVWISFVPAYVSTQGKLAVATEMFAILSSSAGLLFCIFSPKVYIILLQPQLNTRASVSGHQKRQAITSLHALPSPGRTNFRGHQ
ncbi:PREDICTED: extracellular calcium-sensing receptor-like [Nanorana parkeri]|uniref:extracellular calcium-sensing receptor-like n=1 Tax=Nanorana parkeri TaxID=125878 RepID=UPI000854FB17|nr:PREDICTED: extracellular calcium-sensing receptor-like [Nanorana parkeri]